MTDTILGNITGIASEGQGIIRYEGLVIFIPFAVTGDIVRYRIVKQKKNFAVGELVEIVEPSPLRIAPQCPYFGICGGCQLQHLSYDAQLSFKRQWVEDALRKIGGLANIVVPPVIPSQQQWGYRRRINLTLRPNGKFFESGYVGADKQSIVNISQCPIFVPSSDPIIATLQKNIGMLLCAGPEEGKVTILKKNDTQYIVHFNFKKMPENMQEVSLKLMQECTSIIGILATSARKTLQFGSLDNSLKIDNLKFDFSPRAFIQNHPEQSVNIYQAIESVVKEYSPRQILDLYCGIGISSCLLAKQGFSVTGVEANSEAIRLAERNGKQNKLASARFVVATVEAFLEKKKESNDPVEDLTIMNPPREGLSPVVTQALLDRRSKVIIYVSCMPSTLARDLKQLCAGGYTVEKVQSYDMFPQTVHVETVATLQFQAKS